MSAISVTNDTFSTEVLSSPVPVLVDFWASWCGPCKMLSPVVDEIGNSVSDFKVCKVNVDEEYELAEQFGISSIPSLLVFKNGSIANRSVGVISKDAILELVRG